VPDVPAENQQDQKPVVYRAGNLPRELPAWFREADTDQDGQIGLYEWKAKGWPVEQFQNLDRNDDGFLTVDEVLRSVKQPASQVGSPATAGASPGGTNFPQAGGNGGPSRGLPQAGGFRPQGGSGGPGGGFRPSGGNFPQAGGFRPPGSNGGPGAAAP
jgi:hypothetical protein